MIKICIFFGNIPYYNWTLQLRPIFDQSHLVPQSNTYHTLSHLYLITMHWQSKSQLLWHFNIITTLNYCFGRTSNVIFMIPWGIPWTIHYIVEKVIKEIMGTHFHKHWKVFLQFVLKIWFHEIEGSKHFFILHASNNLNNCNLGQFQIFLKCAPKVHISSKITPQIG
jgi:hypothetical protein